MRNDVALTQVMRDLVGIMERTDRSIYRYPGGFWNVKGMATPGFDSFGTSTVQAIVKRGLATYTEHRHGKSGEFPVRATLVAL